MSAGDSSHPYNIFGAPGVMPISACISKNAHSQKFFKKRYK